MSEFKFVIIILKIKIDKRKKNSILEYIFDKFHQVSTIKSKKLHWNDNFTDGKYMPTRD